MVDRRGRSRLRSRFKPLNAAVVAALALSGAFVLLPFLDTLRLTFHEWTGVGRRHFVGGSNLERLATDGQFIRALARSMVFAGLTSILSVAIGTAVAFALNDGGRLRNLARFLIFLPIATPAAVFTAIWRTGLEPRVGWLNTAAASVVDFGDRAWLGDGRSAFTIAIAIAVLHSSGLPMVLVSAAIRDMPAELADAAAIDGATGWQLARHITLPLLRPTVLAVGLLQFTWGFFAFDYIVILTHGGPGTSTEVIATYIYDAAFVDREYGYAAAASAIAVSLWGVFLVGPRLATLLNRQRRHA